VLEAGLRAGHQVTALVRDPEKAEHVARGGTAVIGELSKPAFTQRQRSRPTR
jgi:uncharacterized protein YbjT (DUF2867 family)